MTNEKRVMNGARPREHTNAPWHGKELRRFWLIARERGVSKDGVHLIIEGHYPGKKRLHDLTRAEFIFLMNLIYYNGDPLVNMDLEEHHGNIHAGQWSKIRWLQRRLKWSDPHLTNYICKHGRISHVRFMTAQIARAVIVGMGKIHGK